ncbi:MAG TPA: hypothetical protein VG013_28195 [Gemmataceae bacterium]|nr:hypothetical protein [Gemmataceae bacterium]
MSRNSISAPTGGSKFTNQIPPCVGCGGPPGRPSPLALVAREIILAQSVERGQLGVALVRFGRNGRGGAQDDVPLIDRQPADLACPPPRHPPVKLGSRL